ncbi:polymer-forming cytoskeletal protein [Candidatus Methylacidithermus pantelleriae]|uniref:Polymer-forming cytoskeletal protein n=1 Tax=Candidatus Methylacidithermus pantelleriae TaxID=2744239 RepID=A0A8J2BKZ3_9BACT|nr:polymer-forming cytoskeletal protein [Candidatus Methylacidithermus pantelleriae]CAF0701221.1 conserved hypothetical protein [Candidatus Methylacidithermus pantelleriae]
MGFLFRKGKAKRLLRCPYCGAAQWEAAGAISTLCRSCRKYIALEVGGRPKATARPKPTRAIRCLYCGSEQKVYEDALSTTCGFCGRHLDVGSYLIRGRFGKRIYTQGDVFFAKGSLYIGPEVVGRRVLIGGELRTTVHGLELVEIREEGRVRGTIRAPMVRVAAGADSSVRGVLCRCLRVEGLLWVEGKVMAQEIEVGKRGILEASEVKAGSLQVSSGGGFHARTTLLPEMEQKEDFSILDRKTEECQL